MNRRMFLRGIAGAAGGMTLGPALSNVRAATGSGNGRALVVVFLRGGCDGLNMVVPHGDDAYYAARPSIAIPSPRAGTIESALDIDGYFGLHPALKPLQSSYEQGRLALLPSVHFQVVSRSHFHAQSVIERAGGGAGDGWLNRYLLQNADPNCGLALSNQLPQSLQGPNSVPAYSDPLDLRLSPSNVVDAMFGRVLAQAYISGEGALQGESAAWRDAAIELNARRLRELSEASSAAIYPEVDLGRDLAAAATLLREDPDLSIVMVSDRGWDTHAHQGGATGRQATQLKNLAAALAAFDADLGSRRDDVAVLVQTEFGRTLRENASGGTDHGGASAWMVMSSTLRGGIHLGTRGWPGLDAGSLLGGNALAPAVDFRDVYAELLLGHLGCPDVSAIVPDRPGLATGLI